MMVEPDGGSSAPRQAFANQIVSTPMRRLCVADLCDNGQSASANLRSSRTTEVSTLICPGRRDGRLAESAGSCRPRRD